VPQLHRTDCGGRTCRPGEGNPVVTHGDNPFEFPLPKDAIKGAPHEPDPKGIYAPLVQAAHAAAQHRLLYFCAADVDYREIAHNWFTALSRLGVHNALVYSLDSGAHAYLYARRVTSFDGTAYIDAWNKTRLQRHIQAAEAERHMAAAAIAASGLNVLLIEATHVVVNDPSPLLHALSKAGTIDTAFARSGCNGKPPFGCGLWWNVAYLVGAGPPETHKEQAQRAVQLQLAGIRVGLVDFYLRWWNGAHCIFSGFGKHLSHCDPRLEGDILTPQQAQERPNETAIVKLSKGCDNVRIGVLPASFFSQSAFYGPSGLPRPPGVMLTRSAKPTQRDRLRLDRYDEQDFTELVAAMRADGIWFL